MPKGERHLLWLLLLTLSLALLWPGSYTRAADWPWSEPVELSDPTFAPNGSFPDLTLDAIDQLHAIWYVARSQTGAQSKGVIDLLISRMLHGGTWSAAQMVFATNSREVLVEANAQTGGVVDVTDATYRLQGTLAAGRDGKLHSLYRGATFQLYVNAPTEQSIFLSERSTPQDLGPGQSNALVIGADGTLHMTFNAALKPDDAPDDALCTGCNEIFYRRSLDGGENWSRPENLSRMVGDDGPQQLKVDRQNYLHVVWEHSQSDPRGVGGPAFVGYRRSRDGGTTWEAPVTLGLPNEVTLQGALGLSPEGNPLVVYRSGVGQQIYFQHSGDGGATWSLPGVIPTILARALDDTATDNYSLATDGAGHIHLLLVGFLPGSGSPTPKLLHLTWDGQTWSAPRVVMAGGLYPEGPRLVIEHGNRLHAVWFIREGLSGPSRSRQSVWYSSATIAAPTVVPLATFTPIPSPTLAQPTVTPVILPTTISAASRGKPVVTGPPRWDGQGLALLTLALALVLLLLLIIAWRGIARWYEESD